MDNLMNDSFTEIYGLMASVEEGEIDALKALGMLKELEKAVKNAMDRIKEKSIKEFEKYGQKTVSVHGFEISKTGGGKYKYKAEIWQKVADELESIQEKMKIAYKLNQSEYIDPETGEVYPAATYEPNAESLAYKLAK